MADNEPSTQGDSTGAVNSPKVRSEGSYQCGVCGTGNKTNDGIKEHMKVHDNAITIAENHAIIEDDKEVAKELADFASVLEKDLASGEGDNLDQIRNMVNVDNIVDNLVDNAYRAMNPSREQAHTECHECVCKDENLVKFDKLLNEKEALLVEKNATVKGLLQQVKTLTDEKKNSNPEET